MPKTKEEIIVEIRDIFQTLNGNLTSVRIASSALSIMDLLMQLNMQQPGSCVTEIMSLYQTLDKEVYYALFAGKEMYFNKGSSVTEIEYITAKNVAINKIRLDLSSFL
jgi:hypothetical protein